MNSCSIVRSLVSDAAASRPQWYCVPRHSSRLLVEPEKCQLIGMRSHGKIGNCYFIFLILVGEILLVSVAQEEESL